MKNTKFTLLVIAVALLALLAGCTKRDNPALPTDAPQGQVYQAGHQYAGITGANAIWNVQPARQIRVYTPPGYVPGPVGPRYPVLYLLPGFDGEPSFNTKYGNETYFQISAIQAVADRLIADGEIKPILICLPDASIEYGGSFFANGPLAGKWEDMMASELVTYMDEGIAGQIVFRTLVDKESRAIGGHSSGGYGAMRLAMKYPDLYNSVSMIDAPLAFAGAGDFGGFRDVFDDYLNESAITTEAQYFGTDTTGFRLKPFKVLLYSVAATFSPGPRDVSTAFGKLQIKLPFNYQGTPVQEVWDQWLANDLYSWLDNATYLANINGQKIRIESSSQDRYLFNRQTVAFHDKLTQKGVTHEYATFDKYSGTEVQARTFLYDRLAGILKFHNKYLKDRDGKF